MLLSRADISASRRPEDIALRYMRASPPTDLVGLAAELGIRIELADMGDMSGKIERISNNSNIKPEYKITLNKSLSLNRQRFTLAHEIAHFIKHRRHLEAGDIIDNAMYRSLLPEPMEWEANKYAAQLLMPLSAMQVLWRRGFRTPSQFAGPLGVSEQAAEIRLSQLAGTLELG